MSQEKVDRYKENKAKRKENMAKEKRIRGLRKAAAGIVALALVCWLGYSVYDKATAPDTTPIEVDTAALDDYINNVNAE